MRGSSQSVRRCVPAKADAHALSVARRPATWRNQLSELDSIFGRTSEQVHRIGDLLAPIPTYVITADYPAFLGVSASLSEKLAAA